MLHRRFPDTFSNSLVNALSSVLAAPSRPALAALAPEQREKDEAARIARQRPLLRVSSELALVGIIRDGPGKSGGEWIMKILRDLVHISHLYSLSGLNGTNVKASVLSSQMTPHSHPYHSFQSSLNHTRAPSSDYPHHLQVPNNKSQRLLSLVACQQKLRGMPLLKRTKTTSQRTRN